MARICNLLKNLKERVTRYDNIDVLLSKGIPSHDTLKRVFSLIDSETLETALVDFLERSIKAIAKILEVSDDEKRKIAMDGKEIKGTGRKYNTDEKIRNGQIMHFYDVSTGICIKSQLIEEKTNEIPTAQKILSSLNIKNMIITSDAMNCQKETVRIIGESKGHYVLGIKGNHGDFYKEIKKSFENEPKKNKTNYYKMETVKNHNQVEVREYYKKSAKEFVFSQDWYNIKNVIMYKKTTTNNFTGEEKIERRYYISDLNDIELIGESARRHWAVENELHWHLDTTLYEDANKTTDKRAAYNMSIIKKAILTRLKLMQPLYGKSSIRLIRKTFSVDYDRNLMMLFAFLDEQNLRKLVSSQ